MKLENLSLDELWELFPVIFTDSTDAFGDVYAAEERILNALLDGYIVRISHIGSTSIKNIKTKPIVDVLIEIEWKNRDIVKDILIADSYILMCEAPNKLSFNKGYTAAGYAENVFHIHIQELGNCDELYFRDYLNEHASRAKAYEKLKLQLWEKYKPNRDLYTLGKSEFVAETVKAAKEIYKGRY